MVGVTPETAASYRAGRKNHPKSALAHECFIPAPDERAKSTLFAPKSCHET
jgi:hypothetical protein